MLARHSIGVLWSTDGCKSHQRPIMLVGSEKAACPPQEDMGNVFINFALVSCCQQLGSALSWPLTNAEPSIFWTCHLGFVQTTSLYFRFILASHC